MKRRLLKSWSRYHTATRDYDECVQCEQPIYATEDYTRRVFALPKRFEVERQHEKPDCSQINL